MSDNESQKMTERTLKIRFNTPAFLGNATQNAQWRTPPFKALLRKWWRVVKAKSVDYNYENLLKEENELFGKATDKEASRSKLMLRLDTWKTGDDFTEGNETVVHPNVKGGMKIKAQLYLGYGPITFNKGNKTALLANSSANLSLLFPEKYKDEIEEAVKLIAIFGTIGSRSRNGWGSIDIDGCDLSSGNIKKMVEKYGIEFDKAMKLEWAHCIGIDDKGPLIWKTAEGSFEDVMLNLAEIKIGYRTAFEFAGGKFHSTAQKRHILSYPVTNHDLQGMKNARNPNQLIFKVLRAGDKYFGLIYHMPSKVSDDFFENKNLKADYRKNEKQVWEKVHTHLDARKELRRI